MSLPATQKAVKVVSSGKVAVKSDVPLPTLGSDEILVRVKAVALNPTDWKHLDFVLKPGSSLGCDFAGTVVAIGEAADKKGLVKVGDDVAGFTRGGFLRSDNGAFQGDGFGGFTRSGTLRSDNGAFQEYVATLPELVWRKPSSLPFEDAAAAGGIALSTAVQVFFHRLNFSYTPLSTPEPILIWSGATGVGLYAIRIASVLGYKVVTTSSPHNFELLKSLGASAVFSYRDPETPAKIKQWAKDSGFSGINKALDTISEHGSTVQVAKSLDANGIIITLWPVKLDSEYTQKVEATLVYSALNPENTRDFEGMKEWNQIITKWFEEGKLPKEGNIVPLKHLEGGLEGIEAALDFVRKGKVSGQKVVLRIA